MIADEATGARHRVTAPDRATLLWILGRQAARDAGRSAPGRGWCDDEVVATGIWGRTFAERSFKVVLCRTRKELREAGLDGWCLEKRRGAVRIRVAEAEVD